MKPAFAYFGAAPRFSEPLYVGRPNLPDRQRLHQELDAMLDRRWLSNGGPNVQALEAELAESLGVAQAITFCNGTVALEILLRALDLTGEVIVPSFTFIATVHALQWLGLKPVFCDIDPLTHTLDPAQVEALMTPHTSAILGVHVWGQPCAIEALQALADQHHLTLIFDAAHALGCTWQGQPIGRFGRAEMFSLHATKFVNALEGGVISTQDAALATRLRRMQNFGFTGYDRVETLGSNGKMNEFSAAVGRASLAEMSALMAINQAHYATYTQALAGIPGIQLFAFNHSERHNFQYVILEITAAEFGLSRDQLVQLLHAENVLVRRYFYPGCHQMEPYIRLYPEARQRLPVTEALSQRVLSLPTGTAVTTTDIQAIAACIRDIQAQAPQIQAHLH
jgi:dTDP-4-amino-4,6-dideoxygalactose transaminase